MKKGTNKIQIDKDDHFLLGRIYIQQQDILHLKLDEIMKKKHVQASQIDQIKNMIHNQLENTKQQEQEKQNLSLDLLFEDCLWPFKFERKFLRRLEKHNNLSLIILVQMILEGYFDKKYDTFETQLVEQTNPKLLINYFIFTSQNIRVAILFEVGLKKYPIIEGYQKLRGFKIKHQITFIDIQQIDQINQLLDSMKQYQIDILSDPYKQELPFIYHEQEFLQNKKNVGPQEAFLYQFSEECWGELQFNIKQQKVYRWVPCQLPNYGGNMENFIQLDDDTYVTQNWIDIQEHKNHYRIVQFQNSDQMATYADFQSASNIIDFLTSIDECNIKPTEQEKQVISSDGNLMVIGRSGTGKTTCAILRLFAIHMMEKYKPQLNGQTSDQLFKHSQIKNKLIGLHSLFTTQNLRLVQQVKKKY